MLGGMPWTAPQVTREQPPYLADERQMLLAWLEFHRQTLLLKCAGLTPSQLRERAAPPSTLSLLGLVRHMAEVERGWFRRRIAGEDVGFLYSSEADPDGEFDHVDTADAERDFAAYRREIDLARKAVEGRGLDDTFFHTHRNTRMNVRWVYVHMIEEYARHNGHADLLRQRIDGAAGQLRTLPGAWVRRVVLVARHGSQQGLHLTVHGARVLERHAPGRRCVPRTGRVLAGPLEDHGDARVLAPDGLGDPQRRIESVKHHVGAGDHRALPSAHKRALARVASRPRAKGDVEPRRTEQGEVRDRQGRMTVFDQQPWTPAGQARSGPCPSWHPLSHWPHLHFPLFPDVYSERLAVRR